MLRRLLAYLRLHHHPKKATMPMSATPPITPPATATVDRMVPLLLGTEMAPTAPAVAEEEPVASAAAALCGEPRAAPTAVNRAAVLSAGTGDDVTSGRAVPCCTLAAAFPDVVSDVVLDVGLDAVSGVVCVARAVSTVSVWLDFIIADDDDVACAGCGCDSEVVIWVKVGMVEVVAGEDSGVGAGSGAAGATWTEVWVCCGGTSLVIDVDVVSIREVLIVVPVEVELSSWLVVVVDSAAVDRSAFSVVEVEVVVPFVSVLVLVAVLAPDFGTAVHLFPLMLVMKAPAARDAMLSHLLAEALLSIRYPP